MAKKKSTDLAQTEAIKTRAGMAEKLENERLELKKYNPILKRVTVHKEIK